MNITEFRSLENETKIFYGKISIIKGYAIGNADEYGYQYLGANSCYKFTDLVCPEDVASFISAVGKLGEGSQSVIAKVRCYNNKYRSLCLTINYNGIIIDGYRSFDIQFSDVLNIQENYVKHVHSLEKYRTFMSLSPLLYFEYVFTTNHLLIYKYNNTKCYNVLNCNLDRLKAKVFDSEKLPFSLKVQFDVFYEHLQKKTDGFECNVPAWILNQDKDDVFMKFKSTIIYKDDSKDMVVGIMNPSESIDEEIYYLSDAARDVGTGLLNKRAISEYAKEKINSSTRELYVIMMDIDDFKQINDTYGHMFGDDVISKIAEILKSVLSSRGTVGRFGGDEFLIILEEVSDESDLRRIIKTISKHIQWSFNVISESLMVSASFGTAKFPQDGTSYDELFKKADKCLYIAKAKGKNRFIIYDEKKHGRIDKNKSNKITGINPTIKGQKRVAELSKIINNLYLNGIESIGASISVIQSFFDLDGIAIYSGIDLKRTYSVGNYVGAIEYFSFLEECEYSKLFNENNIYAETNIRQIESNCKTAYEAYKRQFTEEFVQCIIYSDEKPQVVISFDIFNRARKWSEYDIDFFTILGKLIGEILIRNSETL